MARHRRFKFLFGGLKPDSSSCTLPASSWFKFLFGGLKREGVIVSDGEAEEFKFLFGGLKQQPPSAPSLSHTRLNSSLVD